MVWAMNKTVFLLSVTIFYAETSSA